MNVPSRPRRLTVASAVVAMLALSAVPVAAQPADELTDEENAARLEALQAWLANREENLGSVNVIDTSSLPVTIPYHDVLNHVVIPVAFGDDDPLPFMFDTGAGTLLSDDIVEAHGGDVLVDLANVSGGGDVFWSPLQLYPEVSVYDVEELFDLGPINVERSDAAVTFTDVMGEGGWAPDGALYCVSPHGLFGAPAMSNAVWQIDYGTNQLSVATSVDELDHIDGAIAVPFARDSRSVSPTPIVSIGVGDGAVQAIVDTGGGIPLTINTADIATVGVEIPQDAPVNDVLSFGASGPFPSPLTFVDLPMTFGDTELTVPVAIGDNMAPGYQGNVGHGFLQHFVVTFDFTTDTMYLDPLFEGDRVPQAESPAGVGVSYSGGSFIVAAVPEGSMADEAGLEVGEIVTMIDGQNVEDVSLDEFCADYADVASETVTTESGETYDSSPVEDFYGREE